MMCTVIQLKTTTAKVGSGWHGTKPPGSHLFFHSCVCEGGGLPGAGTYVTASLNHASCVISTSGVFSFLASLFLHTEVCSILLRKKIARCLLQQLHSQPPISPPNKAKKAGVFFAAT